jgi:hypothetical protein
MIVAGHNIIDPIFNVFDGRPQMRASDAANTQTLWANSLLPKLPPAITGTTLSRCAGTPSDSAIVQPT